MFKYLILLTLMVSSAHAYVDIDGRVARYHQANPSSGVTYKLETLIRAFDAYAIMKCESIERSNLPAREAHRARQTEGFDKCMGQFYRYVVSELGGQVDSSITYNHRDNFKLYKLAKELSEEEAIERLEEIEQDFRYLPEAQKETAMKIRLLQLQLNILEVIDYQYDDF